MQGDEMMFQIIIVFAGIIVAMLSAVLQKVWLIPAIQQKLESLSRESERQAKDIHSLAQTVQHHEARITILEKTKQETTSS